MQSFFEIKMELFIKWHYKYAVLIDQKNLTSSTFLSDAEIEQRKGPMYKIYFGLWV